MRRLYWWLRILGYLARWMFQFNIGDRVRYDGKEWTLSQGVCAPTWSLRAGDKSVRVHERDRLRDALERIWGSERNHVHDGSETVSAGIARNALSSPEQEDK